MTSRSGTSCSPSGAARTVACGAPLTPEIGQNSGTIPSDQVLFPDGLAVVVFTEQTGLWWLRGLKPGFRHCLAYRLHPMGWLQLDPLSHRLSLELHSTVLQHEVDIIEKALEFSASLRLAGHMALTVPVRRAPLRLAPPMPFSCVEAVKRLLGIHSWTISTPWQLFCFIRKISLDDSLALGYICSRQEQKAYIKRGEALLKAWFAAIGRAWSGRREEGRLVMGGIFSGPSTPPPVAPPPAAENPSEAAARMARERRRRAQGEVISTSYRGLEPLNNAAQPALKKLIGE